MSTQTQTHRTSIRKKHITLSNSRLHAKVAETLCYSGFLFILFFFFFACSFLRLLCGRCHMARHNLRHVACYLLTVGQQPTKAAYMYTRRRQIRGGLQYPREPNQALPTAAVDGHLCRTMGAINGDTRQNTGTAEKREWKRNLSASPWAMQRKLGLAASRKYTTLNDVARGKKKIYKFWERHSVVKCTMNAYIMYNIYIYIITSNSPEKYRLIDQPRHWYRAHCCA